MFFRKPKPLLPEDDQARVVEAIRQAEARTTGEIRVFMEPHCAWMDAMDRARELFLQLGMDRTERHNAVLVYVALKDHQFAVLGDKHIYEYAGGAAFWQAAANLLLQYLKEDKVADGLEACVHALGDALATHFPYDPAITKNELPDEIVFGK